MTVFWDTPAGYEETLPRSQWSPWDIVWLGGRELPGIAQVKKLKVKRKIDKKNGPGRDAATLTHQGYDGAEFDIVLTIWTPDQLTEWDGCRPLIQPVKGKAPSQPLPIEHPLCAEYGVGTVYVEEITDDEGKVRGSREITIAVTEWLPKPKNTGTQTPKKIALPPTTYDQKNAAVPTPQIAKPSDFNVLPPPR